MPYEDAESYAEFYDQMYGDEGDLEFYLEQAKNAEGKVLEIGCGTGRIYLEMLEKGVDAYGIDLSREMLEKLEEKAESRGLKPEVFQADMQEFDLDHEFSLVIVPFRTFLHNLTIDGQLAALESIYKHLEDGGKAVLNFFVPDPGYMADYGEMRETLDEDSGLEERRTEEFDPVERVIEFESHIMRKGEEVASNETRLKAITRPEFELLLRQSPFESWQVYGGFELEQLKNSKQEMVWILKK